ncbi:glucoside xylosyltransferase 2-like [Rhipicephalus sanguineus]|uniref:glucoside xylosyltransferase 2-like n=1 Tax=Rhipicephalus sanguineus TaxID=34632 RepID=UPI0018944D40|nr:glucoside xylosyltransferase 2-like [Rhipicephalus sanguineus]
MRGVRLLVALCVLAGFGCLVMTHLGYVDMRVNWAELRDRPWYNVKDSATFSDVTLRRPPLSEKMTMAFVICENHFRIGIVAVKSAVAYSTTRLHLIIIADKKNEKKMRKEYSSWPDSVKKRVSCDVMPLWFPEGDETDWWAMFAPCASQRLFFPH